MRHCCQQGYRQKLLTRVLAVVSLTLLTACAGVSVPTLQQTAPTAWAHTPDAAFAAPAPDLRHWWKTFADPMLNQLVEQALQENLSLAQAQTRIRSARILLGNTNAAFLPELHAHAQSAQDPSARNSYFQYGLDATWELGLFGRREGRERIAQATLDTAENDAQAIRVSVVAEVVRTYIELRTAQQQVDLQQKLTQLEQQRLALLTTRVGLGLSPREELQRAQTVLTDDMGNLPAHQMAIEQAAQRLAVLLGQAQINPQWLLTAPPPQLAAFTFTSLPADMLRTRPEIRNAEASVLMAAGELGVARADLYPYLALGGAFTISVNVTGNTNSALQRIIDSDTHATPSFGPVIDIPLFDWGRRRAVAHAQEAMLDGAVLAYRQAVLEAIANTESALSALNWQRVRIEQNAAVLNTLQKNTQAQHALIGLGLSSQLGSLDNARQQLQTQLALSDAQASHDLAFIALYKALGGAPLPSANSAAPAAAVSNPTNPKTGA
jgi:NodT family efflux transporter outer membrane factor (OMF) lipoprotein